MSYCEQCAALQRQNDLFANDRDGYVQSLTDQNNKLRAENERLKTSGIAEVAAHNPSVMDWIHHWERRTLKAEAENEKLREALDEAQREITQLYEDAAGESI